MQSKVRETGEHIRLVEASIHLSRGRSNRRGTKFRQFREQFIRSRIKEQHKVSCIREVAKVPITITMMKRTVTQQGPMQVIRRRCRISTGQCTLGQETNLYK